MSQTGPAAGVRRYPRRATTVASTRSRDPNGRVTRSTARLPSPSSDSDPSPVEDDSYDDLSVDQVRTSRPRRTLNNQARQSSQRLQLQTAASTRLRRNPGGKSPQSNRTTAKTSRRHQSQSRGPTTPSKKKSAPLGKLGSAKKQLESRSTSKEPDWPTSKVIPPWQKLEWTLLVQIFEYASYPLDSKANVRWLLSAGLTCKSFLGPALKALYRCPPPLPIVSTNMANKFAALIHHLTATSAAALAREDHRRTMVESLVISVASLSPSQVRVFDIAELILSLPRLSHLELYHEFDLPPYRQLDFKAKKWTYSQGLLDALKVAGEAESAVRLKSWKWSERMIERDVLPAEGLKNIHEWLTFSQLRKVSFVNFQVPSLRESKDPDDPEVFEADKNYISYISESLKPLANLKHLSMESSTVVDGQFLSLLPKTIEQLEIVNCWELNAEMLSEYLITHGRNIRRLILHHNQSLNLEFLPSLGTSCPQLRELSMDLNYFKHHEYYRDSDPNYDRLLTASDIPSWPKTIEIMDLEQLANWDAATAEMFFQSIVDQAPEMPNLRCLAVKAMLDVPWRQRCEFRDKWVGKLRRVFLRKQTKPRSYHSLIQWSSLRQEITGQDEPQPKAKDAESTEVSTTVVPARRSTRIAYNVAPPPPAKGKQVDSKRKRRRSATLTRDLRRPKRANISYRDPDTDEDLELEGSEESEEEKSQDPSPPSTPPESSYSPDEPFIHGLCDIVNIRFDNQKPVEIQYSAEDFLDEENHESEDDDWTSDREIDDDSDVYAW
ncbi:hypothetical protein VP1G_07137 [Cytospora mali]|uniref:Uncharacterized protein n=1 Tax=Cytospora mali TaxID=578113 RepID=A0A194V7R6_CYTMA|nr:hypothetical protein VP1G_07137 [Valsa mali var. pyri (nom. inval.)]